MEVDTEQTQRYFESYEDLEVCKTLFTYLANPKTN